MLYSVLSHRSSQNNDTWIYIMSCLYMYCFTWLAPASGGGIGLPGPHILCLAGIASKQYVIQIFECFLITIAILDYFHNHSYSNIGVLGPGKMSASYFPLSVDRLNSLDLCYLIYFLIPATRYSPASLNLWSLFSVDHMTYHMFLW